MPKKLALVMALLLPAMAFAQDSATTFENYRNWTLVEERPMPLKLDGDTSLTLYVYDVLMRRIYMENVEDNYSNYVAEFVVLGKPVVRIFKGSSNSSEAYQMLVKSEWRQGKAGVFPKTYLVWKQSFPLFGRWKAVGLRVVLEGADGKLMEAVIIK